MISAVDTKDGSPFGRKYLQKWSRKKKNTPELPFLDSLEFLPNKPVEFWHYYREDNDSSSITEIYVDHTTVVWSKNDHVIKVFRGESLIKEAFRTVFYSYPNHPKIIINSPEDQMNSDKESSNSDYLGEPFKATCILTDEKLKIYFDNGEDYFVVPNFEVKKCWPCKFGIIFETGKQDLDFSMSEKSPAWYCLLHPLDDFSRIAIKQQNQIWEQTALDTIQLIYVGTSPSLCVGFNGNKHSVYYIRHCPIEESALVEVGFLQKSNLLDSNNSGSNTPINNLMDISSGKISKLNQSVIQSPGSINSQFNFSSSILSQQNNSASLSHHSMRKFHPSNLNLSSLAYICRSPAISSKKNSITTNFNNTMTDKSESPLIALTLVHIWSEPDAISKRNSFKKASKAFFVQNTIGDNFLCYLQSNAYLLAVVKISGNAPNYHLKEVNHIPAYDAVPIESLKMTLVLDPPTKRNDFSKQSLSLYSGSIKVGRVMFNTSLSNHVQMAHIAHEISTLNLGSKPGTPIHLRTSSRPPSSSFDHTPKFDDAVDMISPIVPTDTSNRIIKISEAVGNQVTLTYSNGNCLRICLPKSSSCPLVNMCIKAISSQLNPELAVQFHSKWFVSRNAPGPTSINPTREWKMFAKCLLDIFGYQTEHFDLYPSNKEHKSPVPCKKIRKINSGSEDDWNFVLSSNIHQETGQKLADLLRIDYVSTGSDKLNSGDEDDDEITIDSSAPFFSYIPEIFMSLHVLYEELKLDKCMSDQLDYLIGLLVPLAGDLNLEHYVKYYWRDMPLKSSPSLIEAKTGQITENQRSRWKIPKALEGPPPSVYDHLLSVLKGKKPFKDSYIFSYDIAKRANQLNVCYSILANRKLSSCDQETQTWLESTKQKFTNNFELVTEYLIYLNYNLRQLNTFPKSLMLPILLSLNKCRMKPSNEFDKDAYTLIGRDDLANHISLEKYDENIIPGKLVDGMEGIDGTSVCKMRWSKDKRMTHVRKMLSSSSPVPITIIQRPEVSDHEFLEEKEKCLQNISVRTMALSFGRGALTLFTTTPLVSETLPIPKLCLTGKAPPGTTVEIEHIEVIPNMERWPLFHNGVATGLKLSKNSTSVDSTWITFNKPHESQPANNTIGHAGFLMGLGLTGHLIKLERLQSFEYLIKGHELINVGLLLGDAATKRGTKDVVATKKISTQLLTLLPPSSTELPLSQTTQIAALVALGLVYEGTGHRHMIQVCLEELGRPPGPEMENCSDRESYSLAAGLALGMITFGKGTSLASGSLSDLELPDLLYQHMVGGSRSALGPYLSKVHQINAHRSYQVKEGDLINVDVTGPGATLALGMMFFDSDNHAIADWLTVPKSNYLLESIRPDFLLLRTLSKGLILWKHIVPSLEWVHSHVPDNILPYALVRPADHHPPNLDYETINQAYCNIISGAAFVMALKFAGTWSESAYEIILSNTNYLIAISKKTVAELAGKATIEQALCVHVLSLSILMSGSGDLQILRIIRYLRSRIGHSTVTYGSHMALHLALGILFLGGGRLTLSTSPRAISAMICAFYPKFPTHSNDNRYHLQALRHLYALAAEPRLIISKDINTKEYVYANFKIELNDSYPLTSKYRVFKQKSPLMLPETRYVKSISLCDKRYHDFKLSVDHLEKLFSINGGVVMIKQKVGCLPYHQDPLGCRSISSAALSLDSSKFQWHSNTNKFLLNATFSQDRNIGDFANTFLSGEPNLKDSEFKRALSLILHECACCEKMELMPFWINLFGVVFKASTLDSEKKLTGPACLDIITFLELAEKDINDGYVSPEIAAAIYQIVYQKKGDWLRDHDILNNFPPDLAKIIFNDKEFLDSRK